MSQSTPAQTPSRRRQAALDTPGSARSTTSAGDRSMLAERAEELELEVHDLRRAIAAERERRRASTQRQREKQRASIEVIDPSGRSVDEVRAVLLAKLREMDDDALTALLSASTHSVARAIAGKDGGAWVAIDAALVPSKSVGVEGTGSGSEIDRRLAAQQKKTGGMQAELQRTRHAASVNAWLHDRQRRSTALVQSLLQFSFLDIDTLDQGSSRSDRDGRAIRSVRMAGTFARLFSIDIRFDVAEDLAGASPELRDLKVRIPAWLETTLDADHKRFSRLLRRNDLPAILLMLRTMIPLLALRRNLYTALMQEYTDLVRAHVRAWESEHGLDFVPWHPPGSSSRKRFPSSTSRSALDEKLGKALIVPENAETLVLRNARQAALTLRFRIVWNRFGHATPQLDAEPNVPRAMLDSTSTAFLRMFRDEFQHLCKVAVEQDGIIALHDLEDQELDQTTGRFGIMPALHATVQAFFRLAHDDDGSEADSPDA